MKKVITMVGTSIFGNYLDEKGDQTFKNYLEDLEDKYSENYEEEKGRINKIKHDLNRWIAHKLNSDKLNISAELKSIWKISQEINEDIEIYFLTSDTILSNLALEVIKENWNKFQDINKIKFYPNNLKEAVVKGLQVKDRNQFIREGMHNLTKRIYDIAGGFWDNIIINITAGYKTVIPYLTILAQINKCPIYYIFEDTEELIDISPTPINIDWGVFEKYSHILEKFDKGDYDYDPNKLKSQYSEFDNFYNDLKTLIWTEGNLAELNPLGKIFWEIYKNSILLKIPKESEYFRLSKPEKQRLHNAVLELYRKLSSVLSGITPQEKALEKIKNLDEQIDLRHGEIIDKCDGVFTFKSTNETHIRFSYTFEINKKGDITSIRIFDFVMEKFNHKIYLEEFKKSYQVSKTLPYTIITIPKGGQR